MRHFAVALRAAGRALHYTRLDEPASHGSLPAQLQADIGRLRPARLVLTAPGDWRVLQAIKDVAQAHGLPLELREDRHFYCTVREFAAHARGRKPLRMEYFYREMRKRHGVLMRGEGGGVPVHHAVLGFPDAPRSPVGRELATRAAGPRPVTPRRRREASDPRSCLCHPAW
jgi:deoxyribodipyrimidine photolyase-like uncharacterized protein